MEDIGRGCVLVGEGEKMLLSRRRVFLRVRWRKMLLWAGDGEGVLLWGSRGKFLLRGIRMLLVGMRVRCF